MKIKRVGVWPGGGADGAHTTGLMLALKTEYDAGYGSSTGSIFGMHVLNRLFREVNKLYVEEASNTDNIAEKSMFNEGGHLKKLWTILRAIKQGKRSQPNIGSSKALLGLIRKHITKEMFDKIRLEDKEFGVVVYDSLMGDDELKLTSDPNMTWEDFCEWIWGSAIPPVVFSTLEKDGSQWHDGGLKHATPLAYAAARNPGSEIDVFMHRPRPEKVDTSNRVPVFEFRKSKRAPRIDGPVKNIKVHAAHVLNSAMELSFQVGMYAAEVYECKVNIYWMEKEYFDNPFVFGREKMQLLSDEGYKLGMQILNKDFPKSSICFESYDWLKKK